MQFWPLTLPGLVAVGVVLGAPGAHADGDNNTLIPNNKRLNDSVVANVFTIEHQAGCTNDVRINPQLQLAAQWHTRDVLNNRNLDGDIGSDGSTPQDRANAAGFHGQVAETVAINQSIAISGNDLLNRWYYNPAYKAIMSNCANSQMGVWSENSPGSHRRGGRVRAAAAISQSQPKSRRGTSSGLPGEQHPARSQPRLRRQRRARNR